MHYNKVTVITLTLMQPLQMKYWMLVHFEARCRMPSSVIREHHDMLIDSR